MPLDLKSLWKKALFLSLCRCCDAKLQYKHVATLFALTAHTINFPQILAMALTVSFKYTYWLFAWNHLQTEVWEAATQ